MIGLGSDKNNENGMIEIPLQSNGNRLVGGRFFLKTNEDMV